MHFNIFTYKNQSNNFKMSLKVSKSMQSVLKVLVYCCILFGTEY